MIAMPGLPVADRVRLCRDAGQVRAGGRAHRWCFPLPIFISLVALLSGVLNSLTRFAIAAFAPALLNIALIVALARRAGRRQSGELVSTVRFMAIAVLLGGDLQFALCWWAVRKAGIRLHFGRPRLTPAVKELSS
jgi:putative peptidoglycan lipid II flippase